MRSYLTKIPITNYKVALNLMSFSNLTIGQRAKVLSYETGNPAYRQLLMSLGLVPGTQFTVRKKAPLGDPIEIEFRGYRLSLRRDEAAVLRIQSI